MSTLKFLAIVLLATTIFCVVYFPREFTLLHAAVLTTSVVLLVLLIVSVASDVKKQKEERVFARSVRETYAKFAEERGELFDRSDVAMNDDDRLQVKRKVKLLLGGGLTSMIVFSVGGYFSETDFYIFLIFIVLLSAYVVYVYFHYQRILKCNFKTVTKGVITDKRRVDDGDNVEYDFEISNKEWIQVRSSDYRKFTFGDIIEIHALSGLNSLALKHEINLVGRMDLKTVNAPNV